MESTTEYEHDGHVHVLLDEITEEVVPTCTSSTTPAVRSASSGADEFTGAYGQRYCLHCGLIEASEHHQHQVGVASTGRRPRRRGPTGRGARAGSVAAHERRQ